jgi:hypothetical protein
MCLIGSTLLEPFKAPRPWKNLQCRLEVLGCCHGGDKQFPYLMGGFTIIQPLSRKNITVAV